MQQKIRTTLNNVRESGVRMQALPRDFKRLLRFDLWLTKRRVLIATHISEPAELLHMHLSLSLSLARALSRCLCFSVSLSLSPALQLF